MHNPKSKNSNFGKGSFPKSTEKPKLTNWEKSGPPKAKLNGGVKTEEPCPTCQWNHANQPPQKNHEKIQKNLEEDINSFMSNKSLFDRLCEEVFNEEEMAPLGAAPETAGEMGGGLGDEMGEEESDDSVTLTLDKETAKKLHDLLGAVLGGEEEGGESIEDLDEEGGEEGEEEGGEKPFPESAEIEELGTTADMTKHGAMKTNANLQMGGSSVHHAKVDVQPTPTPAKKFAQPSMKVTDLPSDVAFKKTGKAASK
jgi:hypothetical protein